MTDAEGWALLALWVVLAVVIIIAAWLCFRRTRVRSFLFLAAVLVLWPWFDEVTELVRKHFTEQVFAGQRPWLFPFSLMAGGNTGWTRWEMSPGEFRCWFMYAKHLLFFLLLAIAFGLIARALKRKRADHQGQ